MLVSKLVSASSGDVLESSRLAVWIIERLAEGGGDAVGRLALIVELLLDGWLGSSHS